MSWLVPAQTSERRLPFFYSSGFPVLNRSLFPGFHTPMTKSPYSATVQVTCARLTPLLSSRFACTGVLAESRADRGEGQAVCLYSGPGRAQPVLLPLFRHSGGEEHLLGLGEGGSWCWPCSRSPGNQISQLLVSVILRLLLVSVIQVLLLVSVSQLLLLISDHLFVFILQDTIPLLVTCMTPCQ